MQTDKTENQPDLPKGLYLANAVHEIRTPVQTIIGTLDLLSDTNLTPEQTEYVHQIRFSSDVLLSLVNDILDYSKIKSKKMTIENIPFDIKSLTEQAVHLISTEAFKKGLEIVTDIDDTLPELVMGAPARIQQVLINLLKNAVKFTEHGYIHIELSARNENTLQFFITDSGMGIPENKRKNLFENYFQGDSIQNMYGGTGLGLAICKELVHQMNGEIGVKPNPYGGSCFYFTLPQPGILERKTKIYQLPVPATTHILIVDDSIMAIKSLEKKLNAIGLQYIQHSTNAKEAFMSMEYAAKLGNPYDIVFIDMAMPIFDGWHLASDIKNTPLLKDTKLYMLVPEGQMGSEAKMKIMDWFAGYLYKPVQRDKLDSLLIETNGTISSISMLEKLQNPEIARQKEEEAQQAERTFAAGIKILIVEDYSVNRRILKEFLEKFGAQVLEAENGQVALETVMKESDIQMVFMDIQMPLLNGIEATKQIRMTKFPGIIIACTANDNQTDFIQYQKIGMNDILIKPFKKENVRNMIDKWKTVLTLPEATQIALMDSRIIANDELWDPVDFEDTIGNDWDLGKQILLDYKRQTKSIIYETKNAIKNRRLEDLIRTSHTLKGSSAAISANRLRNIGESMNNAAKEGNYSACESFLNDFEKAFDLFIVTCNKWEHLK